jgi:hypothetical protein
VFIHASDPAEVWVETESGKIPERGRSVSFALARSLGIGLERISGTVERTLDKGSRRGHGRSSMKGQKDERKG